jgi:hypothetical protein
MYQTCGPKQAYADVFGGLELVDIEIAQDVPPATEDPENFDLHDWALEFSRAVGFDVKQGPVAVED